MSLTSKWWITPGGAFEVNGREHEWLSTAVMLQLPDRMFAPYRWSIDGVPEEELELALERGADPAAVRYLENKKHDSRLYAVREYGWVRTFKNKFNLWYFDCETADMVRKSDYWDFQRQLEPDDVIDVEEVKTGDSYSISVQKLLDGGDPEVLKDLAMSRVHSGSPEVKYCPSYSTAKFSEIERRRLMGKTGDNPRRRSR